MRGVQTVVGFALAVALLLAVACAGALVPHDEREEEATIQKIWPDWLKQPGGSHGR